MTMATITDCNSNLIQIDDRDSINITVDSATRIISDCAMTDIHVKFIIDLLMVKQNEEVWLKWLSLYPEFIKFHPSPSNDMIIDAIRTGNKHLISVPIPEEIEFMEF